MMNMKVKDVEYGGEYILICTFSDGVRKYVDMTPVLSYPAYSELRDKDKFKEFGLDGTVFWSNGADIAPEWLYEHGMTKI